MKKRLMMVLAIMGITIASFAQTTVAVPKNEAAKKSVVAHKKHPVKRSAVTSATASKEKMDRKQPTVSTTKKMKSASANQAVAKTHSQTVAKKVKKDGALDSRYSVNKKKALPVKKNAAPDKQSKEGHSLLR